MYEQYEECEKTQYTRSGRRIKYGVVEAAEYPEGRLFEIEMSKSIF